METPWDDCQIAVIELTKTMCKENRQGLIKLLLNNLPRKKIKDVQGIVSKIKKRRKYCTDPSPATLTDDEDAWFEIPVIQNLKEWASSTPQEALVKFIKEILINYREDELRAIASSYTYHARENPDRVVSRRKSVPTREGWWSDYSTEDILAVDCEIISNIVGRRNNGKLRCKQVAATVSVVSWNYEVVYNAVIKHDPKDVYLTPEAKNKTGFTKNSFKKGKDLSTVQLELDKLFRGKLLILIGAGNDFTALDMFRVKYDVFDLHEYYKKETGIIGLKSIVKYYYDIDFQTGVHDAETDARYTMKIFREKYIPEKLIDNPEIRLGNRMMDEIPTIK